MRDKFSIVTSFCGEPVSYINRLYESIRGQAVNWEWIVTEDFSGNKETKEALINLSNRDIRVRYVEQKKKRELYLDPSTYSEGNYIFHIDADDIVHPNYLLHCLYWFNRFPQVGCILSGGYFYFEEGKRFSRYVIHTEDNLDKLQSYVGRVWRSEHKFEWDYIFSNTDDIIRMNDMFIVRSIECRSDVLCLPRHYIKYSIRENSNSSKKRSPSEIERIEKCYFEFHKWYSENSRESYRDPFFYDIEDYLLGFLGIEWEDIGSHIQYLGKKPKAHQRRKIRELYREYDISFGNLPGGVKIPDIQIIDCTSGFSNHTVNGEKNIIVCMEDDKDSYSHYSDKLKSQGKIHRWIKLWDYIWILSL